MLGFCLSNFCVTLILFQNVKGSWGMEPSSSSGHRSEETAAQEARNYLLQTSNSLNHLENERLGAIRSFHEPVNQNRRQELQLLEERLEKRRNKFEGKYLRVLKGYPITGPIETYAPGSEEIHVHNWVVAGEPLPHITVADTRKLALTSPSALAAPHATIFQQPDDTINLQNLLRVEHDRTRVRLDNLENAYEQRAKVLGTPGESLYDAFINSELVKLEESRQAQRDALLSRLVPGNFELQERKRTEEKMRELFRQHHLDYNELHGLPPHARESTVERDGAPSHAAKLRNRLHVLLQHDDRYVPFRSVNEAVEKSLDDIDVLTHELSEVRAMKKKMRRTLAKTLYDYSIKRLEDRIEVIRRNIDKFIEGRTDAVPVTKYIPGSEKNLLIQAFENNHLNWNREHARVRQNE